MFAPPATKYYPTHARSLDQNIVKPASTDRSYGDFGIEPVDGAGGLDEVRAIPFDAAKIVRPHHMVSGPERLLPVFRFHTNLPAM